MKKKLIASVLYNMNYELATYSCADKLVESPATNAHRGCGQTWLASRAARASSMRYSLTVSVVLWTARGLPQLVYTALCFVVT